MRADREYLRDRVTYPIHDKRVSCPCRGLSCYRTAAPKAWGHPASTSQLNDTLSFSVTVCLQRSSVKVHVDFHRCRYTNTRIHQNFYYPISNI